MVCSLASVVESLLVRTSKQQHASTAVLQGGMVMSTSHDWRPGVSCLVVDRADMQGGVSACVPRIHVGAVEEKVLQVLHHPVTAHLR